MIATMTTNVDERRRAAQLAAAREHIRLENLRDLQGVLDTFGEGARYTDESWADEYVGAEQVRGHYERLVTALPDLHIEIEREHVADEAVVLELTVSGTHLGPWRGMPPTGRGVRFPACAIFTFDEQGKLAGERAYYDRASVLRQVGLFHEPETLRGRLSMSLVHPVTMTRVLAPRLRRRRPRP